MDKIINLLINNWTKGVDTYTHNGSTWLIFTEQKSWVIELTESKTLWYNYNFFKELFSLTSIDVINNQHYITKWVEDNIINKVNYTCWGPEMNDLFVDDALENGVKVIEPVKHTRNSMTKHTIKYGIKETHDDVYHHKGRVDGVIKNGVKETKHNQSHQEPKFKDALKNGIIMSNPHQYVTNKILDDTIQNGEKINGTYVGGKKQKENVEVVIDYGVKEIKADSSQNPMGKVGKVIENGVKETRVCNYKDPNTNLLYIKWDVEINRVIKNGTKNPSV